MSTSEIDNVTHSDKSMAIAECIARLKCWDYREKDIPLVEYASDTHYKGLPELNDLHIALDSMGEELGFDHKVSLAYVSYATGMKLSYFDAESEQELMVEYLTGKVTNCGNLVSFLHSTLEAFDVHPKDRLVFLEKKYSELGANLDEELTLKALSGQSGCLALDESGNVDLLLDRLCAVFGLQSDFVRSKFNFAVKKFEVITGKFNEIDFKLNEEFSDDIHNSMKVCGGLVGNEDGTYSVLVEYVEMTPKITLSEFI